MTLIAEIENFDQTTAFKEGWCISHINGGTNNRDQYEIQRDDESEIFKDDTEVHRWLWNKSLTSPYHYDALRLMRIYCPIEYLQISEMMQEED